jgi:hypothetical protein
MRILSAADVRKALPIPVAIEAMRHAFASLSAGHIHAELGAVVPW